MSQKDDLISRKAAIDALEAIGQNYNLAKAYVVGVIEELPSAEPERKNGKWKQTTQNLSTCTNCGNCILTDRTYGCFFCPNCGADMRGTT